MFQSLWKKLGQRLPWPAAFGRWLLRRRKRVAVLFMLLMQILGAITSVRAIMETRTSQGAIAWAIALNGFPVFAVPAYWVFGQSKFDDYRQVRRQDLLETSPVADQVRDALSSQGMLIAPTAGPERNQARLLERLAKLPFTRKNRVELLIDGEETFDAIFAGIAAAEKYILVQFYILRDDELGRKLKTVLMEKAAAGVRVYVLYDELGSARLSDAYHRDLRAAGALIWPFNTTQGRGNRLRLNFRNHRKIVVVDGRVAYVGGLNVGDEYLGKDPQLSPWRDTHVEVRGPVVQFVQVPFLEDWHWATGETLELDWVPQPAGDSDNIVMCLPTGPADELETATLFFLEAINSAQQRLWIVSPYFVPDEQLMSALQLAALRGVDVRILIPETPDQQLVYLSSFSYLQEAEKAGVNIYRYLPGFLHQKVMLVDDRYAAVGTANLDNRSMRLNFEVTMVVIDEDFAREMEAMLLEDFHHSRRATAAEYTDSSFLFRLSARVARLLAPIQ